jgi:hypothetical protein
MGTITAYPQFKEWLPTNPMPAIKKSPKDKGTKKDKADKQKRSR